MNDCRGFRGDCEQLSSRSSSHIVDATHFQNYIMDLPLWTPDSLVLKTTNVTLSETAQIFRSFMRHCPKTDPARVIYCFVTDHVLKYEALDDVWKWLSAWCVVASFFVLCINIQVSDVVLSYVQYEGVLISPYPEQDQATKLGIYWTYSPRRSIQFLALCSNFCKPHKKKKKNSEGCPSNHVSAAAKTSASDEKWRPYNCFFSPGNRW